MNKALLLKLRKVGINFTGAAKVHPLMRLDCEAPIALSGQINLRGSIGAYSYVRGGRLSGGLKSIGRYCSIAPGLTAGDSNHPTNWLSTHPFQHGGSKLFQQWTKKPEHDFVKLEQGARYASHIGNDVWIGANVMLMPGVTLGDGSIVGAGAIVTRDVPPYAIVAGSPAKVIRYRFEPHIIEQLLELQWWRFDADSMLGVDFCNVESAIAQIRALEQAGSLQLISDKKVRVLGRDLLAASPRQAMTIKSLSRRFTRFVKSLFK